MLKLLLNIIDTITEWSGKISQFFLLPIIGLTIIEVILRYFFNAPTVWLWPITTLFFGGFIILTGAYTLLNEEHIRIDIVWGHFNIRKKAIANVVSSFLFFLYTLALIKFGWNFAYDSAIMLERDLGGVVPVPLWPSKVVFYIAVVLMFCQGAANLIRDLSMVSKGRDS